MKISAGTRVIFTKTHQQDDKSANITRNLRNIRKWFDFYAKNETIGNICHKSQRTGNG